MIYIKTKFFVEFSHKETNKVINKEFKRINSLIKLSSRYIFNVLNLS